MSTPQRPSGNTTHSSRPGSHTPWPAALPFNSKGLVTYAHPVGDGYELYELPVERLSDGRAVNLPITTYTITGAPGAAGTMTLTVHSELFGGTNQVEVPIVFADAAAGDTVNKIGTLARAALLADETVNAYFRVGGSNASFSLTPRYATLVDPQSVTATALGTVSIGTVTTTYAAPLDAALQVTTATVDSTGDTGATGSANTNVTVTSALFDAPVVVAVALTAADNTNDKVATAIRAALAANTTIATHFTVSGATDKVILTAKIATDNDTTLNIAIAAGNGILAAADSAETTAGSYGTRPAFYGQMVINGTSVRIATTIDRNTIAWTALN